MKHATVVFFASMLCLSIWPAPRLLAALDAAHNAGATPQLTTRHTLLELAERDDEDDDKGYAAGEHHHEHGKHENESEAEEKYRHQQFCGPYFKPDHVSYFRNYYSQNDYANLPPGLRKHVQKTGHLPPGLEKQYARTGQLPPGLRKRFECGQTLPGEYAQYLYPVPALAYERVGPLPPDSTLYLYANDLILLNDHTKAIIDILRGAY